MLRKFKIPIIGLIFVLANQAVSYAVHAAMPETLLTQGTTRYAVVSSTHDAYTSSGAFATLPGMSTTISIPSGKVGDVMVFFCSDGYADTTMMQVRAIIGGVVGAPYFTNFIGDNTTSTRCANFYRKTVGAGTPVVTIQWKALNGVNIVFSFHRSMIVMVNIH